jgi:hypothetical protein
MSLGEKLAFNFFMLIFLGLLMFTAVTYIPPLILIVSRPLLWLAEGGENQVIFLK